MSDDDKKSARETSERKALEHNRSTPAWIRALYLWGWKSGTEHTPRSLRPLAQIGLGAVGLAILALLAVQGSVPPTQNMEKPRVMLVDQANTGEASASASIVGDAAVVKANDLLNKQQSLDDGSVISMPVTSKVNVHYSEAHRIVELLQGEAIFDVAKDALRPFTVVTDTVKVTAVGTRFHVIAGKCAQVRVLEGVVRVWNGGASADATAVTLKAGGFHDVPRSCSRSTGR